MKFDVELPTSREGIFVPVPFAGPKEIIRVLQESERLGFNAVWGTDFMTRTRGMGGIPDDQPPNWYELLMVLSYAAAVTQRIKLATGVILLPYRDPIILAKQLATLDHFSNGRLIVGLGLGFARDEFESIRPRAKKAHRGRMMDEKMEALKLLLSRGSEEVSYKGEYVEFQGVNLNPKPVQDPLPVYAPGRNPAALRRIARWGDGLLIPAAGGRGPVDDILPLLEEQGRSISDIDVVAEAELCLAKTHEEAVKKYRESRMGQFRLSKVPDLDKLVSMNWIGTPEEVTEKIAKVKDQGVTHFNALHIAGDTVEEMLEQMQTFAGEVMSKFD